LISAGSAGRRASKIRGPIKACTGPAILISNAAQRTLTEGNLRQSLGVTYDCVR
jgi:hypothetical protein